MTVEDFLAQMWYLTENIRFKTSWLDTGKAEKYNEVENSVKDIRKQAGDIEVLCDAFLRERE